MERITAILLSLLTTLSLFFGVSGNPDYKKQSGLKEAINSLINKTEITQTKYKGEVSTYNWSEEEEFSLENTVVLTKQPNKDFVILNISDTHFSDYDHRAFTAFDVEAKVKSLVSSIKPDLITVTGDIVCTDSTYYAIRRITDLFESFGIPWAPVYGNHDDEGNCDLNYLADIMMSSPNCVMQKGDPEMGVGNYIINIAEEQNDGSLKIIESLIMMDSHHSQANEKQVKWFTWATDGINRISNNSAEISVVCHIPIPEYQYAYDEAWDKDNNRWKDGFDAYGEKNEEICCEKNNGIPVQRGFFDAIKNSGTTKFVFCGHEHLNNFSIKYQGVRLTYCLKIGVASGSKFKFSGGTQININSDGIYRISHKSIAFGPIITIEDITV